MTRQISQGDSRKVKPPRSGRRPVDPETRARIEALAAEGMARNAIARELGISSSTVTKYAPAGSFDRSASRAAVEARQWDARAARTALSEQVLVEARRLIELTTKPHEITHWDRDGILHRAEIERPTSGDVRNYAVAAAVLIDKHVALVRVDSDDRDLPAVDAWLAHIAGPAATGVAA